MHGFQVRTPICHIVPVSRAYLHMREIGTMWQIGVLAGKPCTFLGPKWVIFGVLGHYKNKERLSRGLGMKWRIPSTCLDASRNWFSTGIYSINWAPSD